MFAGRGLWVRSRRVLRRAMPDDGRGMLGAPTGADGHCSPRPAVYLIRTPPARPAHSSFLSPNHHSRRCQHVLPYTKHYVCLPLLPVRSGRRRSRRCFCPVSTTRVQLFLLRAERVPPRISLSGLSSSCQSTLTSIVISPASSCLNAQGLVAIATTSANASLIGPLNSWLSGMCGQPACSNTTLTDIVSNVTSGCASDLSNLGATGFTPQSISDVLVAAYPALREAACLTECVYGSFRARMLLLILLIVGRAVRAITTRFVLRKRSQTSRTPPEVRSRSTSS